MEDLPPPMDRIHAPWTTKAEAAIRALRDVEGVNIQADGDDIREIHILTASNRPAKQIVRDVQTLLLTRFHRSIDHRVVSVAFAQPQTSRKGDLPPDRERAPRPSGIERIRFGSVNLYVSGRRVQAQVELKWKGVSRMGSASGWSTRDGADRLIATATLATLQEFLEEGVALHLEGIERIRVGRKEAIVAGLVLLAHREQKGLVGCCTVEEDYQQAVVLATLAALNRVVGGLPTKEPTEYVLRPTST